MSKYKDFGFVLDGENDYIICQKSFFVQIPHEGVKNLLSVSHLLTPESFSKE